MKNEKSKVYALLNSDGYITRIDGGYTICNITDFIDWVLIDEGYGDRYNLCQTHYLPGPLTTDSSAYRYKLVEGNVVECSAEEIAQQEEALKPNTLPSESTIWDELDAAYQSGIDSI